MARGDLTETVRDWLYEKRFDHHPSIPVGGDGDLPGLVPVADALAAVNRIRITRSDDGAVRRAMESLTGNGVAKVKVSGKWFYQWTAPDMPSGYVSTSERARQNQAAAAKGGNSSASDLHHRLAQEMGQARGETGKRNIKPEEAPPLPENTITYADGGIYKVRSIAGKRDVDLLRTLRDRAKFALLFGAPGTGKTSLIRAAFGEDLITFPGDENTTVGDMFGGWVPDGKGSWVWVNGPATTAVKDGKVLFVDDITIIDGKVLAALYPLLDGRDETILKEHMVPNGPDGKPWPDGQLHPEVIHAKKGFYIVGAHNPGTVGAFLSDALSSRFSFQMEVDTDLDMAASLGVPPNVMKVARNLYTAKAQGQVTWVPQMRELLAARDIAAIAGEEAALANLVNVVAEETDRDFIQNQIRTVMGRTVENLKIGRQI